MQKKLSRTSALIWGIASVVCFPLISSPSYATREKTLFMEVEQLRKNISRQTPLEYAYDWHAKHTHIYDKDVFGEVSWDVTPVVIVRNSLTKQEYYRTTLGYGKTVKADRFHAAEAQQRAGDARAAVVSEWPFYANKIPLLVEWALKVQSQTALPEQLKEKEDTLQKYVDLKKRAPRPESPLMTDVEKEYAKFEVQ